MCCHAQYVNGAGAGVGGQQSRLGDWRCRSAGGEQLHHLFGFFFSLPPEVSSLSHYFLFHYITIIVITVITVLF